MKERIEEQYSKIEDMKEALANELYLHVEQLARAALHDLYEIMLNLKVTGRPMKIAGAFEPTLRDW